MIVVGCAVAFVGVVFVVAVVGVVVVIGCFASDVVAVVVGVVTGFSVVVVIACVLIVVVIFGAFVVDDAVVFADTVIFGVKAVICTTFGIVFFGFDAIAAVLGIFVFF